MKRILFIALIFFNALYAEGKINYSTFMQITRCKTVTEIGNIVKEHGLNLAYSHPFKGFKNGTTEEGQDVAWGYKCTFDTYADGWKKLIKDEDVAYYIKVLYSVEKKKIKQVLLSFCSSKETSDFVENAKKAGFVFLNENFKENSVESAYFKASTNECMIFNDDGKSSTVSWFIFYLE